MDLAANVPFDPQLKKKKKRKNTAVIESLGRGKQAGQRTERGGVATYRREDEAACVILTFKWRQRKSRHQLLNCRVDISPPPK